MDSGLYGLKQSNRSADDHWGKNCFNSSFPTSLCSYMLDNSINAAYVSLHIAKDRLTPFVSPINISDVFNSGSLKSEKLEFDFETKFDPYKVYSADGDIDPIDLVVKDPNSKSFLAPREIKLTVFPDNGTSNLKVKLWGSEIVVRSATTSYCAFEMIDNLKESLLDVRSIFERVCVSIKDWGNEVEVGSHMGELISCLNLFEKKYYSTQKPLLIQTLWKTKGKSPLLADKAFCVVVWSDYAISRLFIDRSESNPINVINRPNRASARLAKCLWELSRSGNIDIDSIYKLMVYSEQSDKEFSVPGSMLRKYIPFKSIKKYFMAKEILNSVIQKGYIDKLSPERRFDQTLYFTYKENK